MSEGVSEGVIQWEKCTKKYYLYLNMRAVLYVMLCYVVYMCARARPFRHLCGGR